MKAKFCVNGKNLLYDYLQERNIPFNKCGKLIVATNEDEVLYLDVIRSRALANNVNDLSMLDGKDVSKLEPEIKCLKAILSPSTGIFDSSSYVQNLLSDIEQNNGTIVYNCTVNSIKKEKSNNLFQISSNQGDIECDILINAAGLNAPQIIKNIDQYPSHPTQYYSKGNYFKLTGHNRPNFQRLVYPVPSKGGLGIHLTIDMNFNVKFGPDSEWLSNGSDSNDNNDDNKYIFNEPPPLTSFNVNEERSKLFYDSIKQYYPSIPENSLIPDFASIRPKIHGPNSKIDSDFIIETKEHHNIDNLICLYGIESPGLTSSLYIGQYVKNLIVQELTH